MNDPLTSINAEEVEKNVTEAYKTMHKSVRIFQDITSKLAVENTLCIRGKVMGDISSLQGHNSWKMVYMLVLANWSCLMLKIPTETVLEPFSSVLFYILFLVQTNNMVTCIETLQKYTVSRFSFLNNYWFYISLKNSSAIGNKQHVVAWEQLLLYQSYPD